MTNDDSTDASRKCWFCGKRIDEGVYFSITVDGSLENFHAVCLFSFMGGEERSRIRPLLNRWQDLIDAIRKSRWVHK